MLNKLSKAPNSTSNRKRVGRGPGSTDGKTCGKGHKGQKARSGNGKRIGFEGGQMPLHRRLPKRGFYNPFKQEFSIVNLKDLVDSKKLDLNEVVNAESLAKAGLIASTKNPLKVLGVGELTSAIKVEADQFSKTAEEKIKAAGGEAKLVNG